MNTAGGMSGAGEASTSESDTLIAISALQHVIFCARQAALIHVERVWQEDAATADGKVLHERVDLPGTDMRRTIRVERAVTLRSDRLGMTGRADVVEYHGDVSAVVPYPVEYKRGRAKESLADQVQLCAQGMCLEEMHGVAVPRGALFYGENHRRMEVVFTEELRKRTEEAAREVHALVRRKHLPGPEWGPKCSVCSLEELCLPTIAGRPKLVQWYLDELGEEER